MGWLIAIALLALPSVASAEVFTMATFGDIQQYTQCTRADNIGHDVGQAAADYIVARASVYDLVLSAGDITLEDDFDCECEAQTPGPCAQYSSSYQAECASCADAEAVVCTGGTPGYSCAWSRARTWFTEIEAAGIPWIASTGNHDIDYDSGTINTTYNRWHEFFSPATGLGKERGSTVSASGSSLSYLVVNAAGIDWLFITLPWEWPTSGSGTVGLNNRVKDLRWVRGVLDNHLGMPTTIMSHRLGVQDPIPPGWTCGGYVADGEAVENTNLCFYPVGRLVWQLIGDYPQVWLLYSQHDQTQYHEVSVHPVHGYPVLTLQADDMYDGVVTTIRVDPVGGAVSMLMYLTADLYHRGAACATCPKYMEDLIVASGGDLYRAWEKIQTGLQFDFCKASPERFNLPQAACEEPLKVTGGCTQCAK